MDEMEKRQGYFPASLDSYVQQGRMFLFNAAQNLIQYGRVLVEAKPLVPRGQFENWVQTNFNMSERTAQQYMAVWKRFGKNENLQAVQFSNLQKMLALPEGAETKFSEEHDLENMTAREVEKAVKAIKAEAQSKIDRERAAREDAERRAMEAEREASMAPAAMQTALREKDAEISKYQEQSRQFQEEAEAAKRDHRLTLTELQSTKQELREAEEMLAESQQSYDRMQAELLNAQSTIARGDAERVISEQLTAEDFSAAVRAFLGSVAQMPYMGATFSQIVDMREYRQWDELLQAVEDWAVKARQALKTTDQKGDIIDG